MIGSHLARLRQEFKKGFGETVAEVMDAEVEGEDEIHPSKRPRVAERVGPAPGQATQNLDFDVASIFGDCERIQKAAVRRGYPVMRSRVLNFGDDIMINP